MDLSTGLNNVAEQTDADIKKHWWEMQVTPKDGKEHYARITWVSTKKSKVHYVDSEGPGTIDMNELDGSMGEWFKPAHC